MDTWGGVVFVIGIVLILIYINIPRDHDDEEIPPWV